MFSVDSAHQNYRSFLAVAILGFCCLLSTSIGAQEASDDVETPPILSTSERSSGDYEFTPVRTDSPRQTLTTILALRDDIEEIVLTLATDGNSETLHQRTRIVGEQFGSLFDLSSVPVGLHREIVSVAWISVVDILGRIELPELDTVPDIDDEVLPSAWRIPDTPLRIVRITEGPRVGEFLFSAQTIQDAPRFYQGIESLPLRSRAGIESWTRLAPQLTGPLIPASVSRVMPDTLKRLWLDTPIWKVATVFLLMVVSIFLIMLTNRLANSVDTTNKASKMALRTLTPIAILLIVQLIEPIIAFEINIYGRLWIYVDYVLTGVVYAASARLFWVAVRAVPERLIIARNLTADNFDAQFLLLGGKALAFVGSLIILGTGAQALGLPIYSIVAGLGIGGLAVALAIRPTLENLIAGVILYLDQPVSVGDYCRFGDTTGTVESIGIRTTKLRAIDRTLITVPNAALADMQIINWAECDQMLISAVIGLRYETTPDQLRYVLVKIREMLHSHPGIDGETIRVRFGGYGPSSLDVNLRIYALTQDWNEFHAIREDVFLRINDVVMESGSDFAMPSQTLYMARDDGLDDDRGNVAKNEVEEWRQSGKLPFPKLSAKRIKELEGTLDWPPRGSINIGPERQQTAEPLSTDSEEPNEEQTKN